jgi:hypothetical protein
MGHSQSEPPASLVILTLNEVKGKDLVRFFAPTSRGSE